MMEYHAAYHEGENGWVVATILDYPGVLTQGRTLKSARGMIRDALRAMAECDIEEGRPLPRPDPDVRAAGAIFTETIALRVRVQQGSQTMQPRP